ncbi:MAG: hypothetical protein JOY93_13100 [Acidobacteriales bacterium]|nr:hypothetical protein [Terriglobales bacterium]
MDSTMVLILIGLLAGATSGLMVGLVALRAFSSSSSTSSTSSGGSSNAIH